MRHRGVRKFIARYGSKEAAILFGHVPIAKRCPKYFVQGSWPEAGGNFVWPCAKRYTRMLQNALLNDRPKETAILLGHALAAAQWFPQRDCRIDDASKEGVASSGWCQRAPRFKENALSCSTYTDIDALEN